jgi:DNA-binding XRE family transcriptional regulator
MHQIKLGLRIRMLRNKFGYTQKDLSEIININPTPIIKLNNVIVFQTIE